MNLFFPKTMFGAIQAKQEAIACSKQSSKKVGGCMGVRFLVILPLIFVLTSCVSELGLDNLFELNNQDELGEKPTKEVSTEPNKKPVREITTCQANPNDPSCKKKSASSERSTPISFKRYYFEKFDGATFDTAGRSTGTTAYKAVYGTYSGKGKEASITEATFKAFESGNIEDSKYSEKNNIIKFSFDAGGTDIGYYYNHINRRQFKNFLPAVNKLDILSRQSDNTVNKIVEINEGDVQDQHSYSTWESLKASLGKAASKTYSGLAQLQFGFYSKSSDNVTNLLEKKIHQGNFKLTINNIFGAYNYDKADNYYSMEIDLDNTVEGVTVDYNKSYTQDDANKNRLPKSRVKKIALNNVNFAKPIDVAFIDVPPAGITYYRSFKQSKLLLYEEGEIVTQLAGVFGIRSLITRQGGDSDPTSYKYINIAFASNDYCTTGTDGCIE